MWLKLEPVLSHSCWHCISSYLLELSQASPPFQRLHLPGPLVFLNSLRLGKHQWRKTWKKNTWDKYLRQIFGIKVHIFFFQSASCCRKNSVESPKSQRFAHILCLKLNSENHRVGAWSSDYAVSRTSNIQPPDFKAPCPSCPYLP